MLVGKIVELIDNNSELAICKGSRGIVSGEDDKYFFIYWIYQVPPKELRGYFKPEHYHVQCHGEYRKNLFKVI